MDWGLIVQQQKRKSAAWLKRLGRWRLITAPPTKTRNSITCSLRFLSHSRVTVFRLHIPFAMATQQVRPSVCVFDTFVAEEQFSWLMWRYSPSSIRFSKRSERDTDNGFIHSQTNRHASSVGYSRPTFTSTLQGSEIWYTMMWACEMCICTHRSYIHQQAEGKCGDSIEEFRRQLPAMNDATLLRELGSISRLVFERASVVIDVILKLARTGVIFVYWCLPTRERYYWSTMGSVITKSDRRRSKCRHSFIQRLTRLVSTRITTSLRTDITLFR